MCDAVKVYEYTFVQAEVVSEEGAEGETVDIATSEELVRVELEGDQNFMKQDCLRAVEQAIEFQAAEEAAAAKAAAAAQESAGDLEEVDTAEAADTEA